MGCCQIENRDFFNEILDGSDSAAVSAANLIEGSNKRFNFASSFLFPKQNKDLSYDFKLYNSSKNYKKQIPDYDFPNPYTDAFFPPNENSVIYVEAGSELAKDITPKEIEDLSGLQWLRPSKIFGHNNYFIYDKLEINDIHQGILGDCYFLSSVSAIAEYPERFNKIFITKQKTKNGCISVQFYLHGKPKVISIDDHFPCYKHKNGKLFFALAYSGENELWVSILEKAWAKVCGSYAQTIAGLPSEALATLTEAPTISYIHRRYGKEKIWQELLTADINKFIICTNSTHETEAEKLGIVNSHAYTLIGCKEAQGIRFVQLRNPWGSWEWKGEYSDSSKLWNDDLKKELGYVNSNDGVFFMTFEDFFKYFPYTFSCKYHDNFIYSYKKVKPSEPSNMMCAKINIYSNTKIYIGLHQKTARFYKKINGYKASYARLIVARYNKSAKNGENYEYIGSEFASQEKNYVSIENLVPGEYHIFGQINWPYHDKCSVVFSTYASQFTPVEYLNREEVPNNYLSQIMYSYIKTKKSNELTKEVFLYHSIEDNHTGYFITTYENLSEKDSVFVSFEAVCNEYVNLCSKHLGFRHIDNKIDKIGFYIPPRANKTILFEVLDIYKSDLKIGKYKVDTVSCYLTKEDDSVKLYLGSHLEFLEKEQISRDCLYMEFHENNTVYLIFMNNGHSDYNLSISYTQLSNLNPAEDKTTVYLKSHTFIYFKLNVIDIKANYEVKISYKLKLF